MSQIPDFHNMAWLSVVAAIMSFSYSSIGLGLGLVKVIGILLYMPFNFLENFNVRHHYVKKILKAQTISNRCH